MDNAIVFEPDAFQNALCSFLEPRARDLTDISDLEIRAIIDSTLPKAWTTGDEIYLNFAHLGIDTDAELVELLGMFYHSVGHTLSTPRMRGRLREYIRDLDFRVALLLAEDWRSDSLLAERSVDAQRYLRLTAKSLSVQQDWQLYLLSAGRFYLPSDDRHRHYCKAIEQEGRPWVEGVQEIADEYVSSQWSRLDAPNNYRLKELAEQLSVLLKSRDIYGGTPYITDLPSNGMSTSSKENGSIDGVIKLILQDQKTRLHTSYVPAVDNIHELIQDSVVQNDLAELRQAMPDQKCEIPL